MHDDSEIQNASIPADSKQKLSYQPPQLVKLDARGGTEAGKPSLATENGTAGPS